MSHHVTLDIPANHTKQSTTHNTATNDSTTSHTINLDFDPLASLSDNIFSLWIKAGNALKHSYLTATDTLLDELLVRGSEQQLNDALYQFVVKNVDMLHKMHIALHDNWIRLSATVYTSGIFASVACNFRLVSIELNGDYQRLILEQLSDTEIIQLHSKQWYIATGAKIGVWLYRTLLKKDPLAFALQQIDVKEEPFAVHKGRYIYLDISRYFAGSPDIVSYFKKAQINTAYTTEGNLLAKVQINFGELINFGADGDNIITEDDSPEAYAKQQRKKAQLNAQIAKKQTDLADNTTHTTTS